MDVTPEDKELINDSIEELTTTGKQELEMDEMTKLKNLCRKSKDHVKLACELLMIQLERHHAEVRFSTFQVINQLFLRSHSFRELIIFNLHTVFELTIETDKRRPMPPPLPTSKMLKKLALTEYNKWFNRYAKGYRKLQLGLEYLRDVKNIRFKELEVQTHAEQVRLKQQLKKEEQLKKSKLEQVDIQFFDLYDTIKSNIQQMERCFELIVPKTATDEIKIDPTTNHEHVPPIDDRLMSGNETGFATSNFSVTVKIHTRHKIHETPDNVDILKQLQGLYKEVNKQSDTVKRWLNVLIKCRSQNGDRIKEILNLKNKLTAVCTKYTELDIRTKGSDDYNENDEEDEFIDVPERSVEERINQVKDLEHTSGYDGSSCSSGMSDLPSSSSSIPYNSENSCIVADRPSSSSSIPSDHQTSSISRERQTSSREDRLRVAPIVPFDTDIKCWGADKIEVPSSVKYDSLHRFWKTSEYEEAFVPPQLEASVRERRMIYQSKFEPVTRMCGALLPSGRPCERMDRYKCPFHGPIVERDMFGHPVNPVDAERELKKKQEKEEQEKVNIQKDIDAMLGTSLSKKNSNRKRKLTAKEKTKVRYNRLTKISKESDTANARLKKKVLSTRSLDKMSETMNKQMRRKHEEKFGSNFNYN